MANSTKQRKDKSTVSIKRRLSAALVMLLISTVMLVTSTYAWFTLSTAPEVKGIDTSVAGNGSLEVALMPANGQISGITSGRSGTNGGGSVAVRTANNTWGNLVTLSDSSYGFQNLALRPAAMTIDDQDGSIDFAIPEFGYDGRITRLNGENVALKAFNINTGDFTESATPYGVRAIVISDTVGEGADAEQVTTTYGYAVDLAFRINTTTADGTNAELRLQQQAIQRVYNGSGEDGETSIASPTQGSGSYFKIAGLP